MGNDLKTMSVQQAAKAIIRLLPRISDEQLIRLTYLGKWLSKDPEVLGAVEKVRQYLETPGHPAKLLFKRVLGQLSPRGRIKLFETLFNGALFQGGALRDAWERKLGFRPPCIMILSPTLRCNLRCKGCYTLGYGTKPELSRETAEKLLDECEELGIHFITILGGEPLVYPHLFPLLERHPSIFFPGLYQRNLDDPGDGPKVRRSGKRSGSGEHRGGRRGDRCLEGEGDLQKDYAGL